MTDAELMNPCTPIHFTDLVVNGEVVNTIAPDRDPCRTYEPNDVCGGCHMCALRMAIHYGLKPYPADECTMGRKGRAEATL